MTPLTAIQEALYHIQADVRRVREALAKCGDDERAVADLYAALSAISEALGEALDAHARLPGARRP